MTVTKEVYQENCSNVDYLKSLVIDKVLNDADTFKNELQEFKEGLDLEHDAE